MRTPRPAPLRARRAVSVGAVSGMGAVLAHGIAGGATPPIWLTALAVLVGIGAALPLTRARIDLAGLGAAALLSQAVLHLGLTLATPTSASDHGDGAMLVAHGLATALTLAVARASEQAWWRIAEVADTLIARTLGAIVPVLAATAVPTPRRVALAVAVAGVRPADAHASPRRTRGPPAVLHRRHPAPHPPVS